MLPIGLICSVLIGSSGILMLPIGLIFSVLIGSSWILFASDWLDQLRQVNGEWWPVW